jgi:pantetheine-phosphate adenylyltransferase
VTNGHVDVVTRAARLFDEVVVAIGVNASKNRMFTADERLAMLEETFAHLDNVRIDSFSGLVVDYCAAHDVVAIVKGLRGPADFEYELPMAHMNARMVPVETVFVPTDPRWSYVSSSLMKEVVTFGGDVEGLLPEPVVARLRARVAERRAAAGG